MRRRMKTKNRLVASLTTTGRIVSTLHVVWKVLSKYSSLECRESTKKEQVIDMQRMSMGVGWNRLLDFLNGVKLYINSESHVPQ